METEEKKDTAPDPEDWAAWRAWWDAQEPKASGSEAWLAWSDERERRRDQAERRCNMVVGGTCALLVVERREFTGIDLCAELYEYGLGIGALGMWLDWDKDGNWLDEEDGLPRLAIPVDAWDERSYIELALATAWRVEGEDWQVTGFEHPDAADLGDQAAHWSYAPTPEVVERLDALLREIHDEEDRVDYETAVAAIARDDADPDKRTYSSAEMRELLGLGDDDEEGAQ